MDIVRIGIIGFGTMGKNHYKYIMDKEVTNGIVTAVFDVSNKAFTDFSDNISTFDNIDTFFKSKLFDAVLIATPHYFHPQYAIKAFNYGYHVLLEKPAGVYTKQVRIMNEVATKSNKVFSMMYNQRTNPLYKKAKQLIDSGEIGQLKRTIWIITNWYRPQSYFNASSWRATWKHEGGGVLLNQDPHQLDLWQWLCGMPTSIQAFCSFGKYHDIEVEDDVTAYVEFKNGATGVFITSTGESPGTNRLEISGDKGQIIIENETLTFKKLTISERQFNKEFKGGFGQPECWDVKVPIETNNPEHKGITQNFINAILYNEKLIAPGSEGINGLTLSNAMLLSTWKNKKIVLPIDEEEFYKHLNYKIKNSKFIKTTSEITMDVKDTF